MPTMTRSNAAPICRNFPRYIMKIIQAAGRRRVNASGRIQTPTPINTPTIKKLNPSCANIQKNRTERNARRMVSIPDNAAQTRCHSKRSSAANPIPHIPGARSLVLTQSTASQAVAINAVTPIPYVHHLYGILNKYPRAIRALHNGAVEPTLA